MEEAQIDYDNVLHATATAILFEIEEDFEVWIPKSQIIDHDVKRCCFTIPQWLAEEKELV